MIESLCYAEICTRFGVTGVIWKENPTVKVQRIILQIPESQRESMKHCENIHPQIKSLLDFITRFLLGENVSFNLDVLDFDLCSDFQKKVLLAEYNIPRGSVSTYSRIANHIGIPKAARAVGNALANNPFPLVIPCHRAVRSDGSLGGYQGGLKMKKQLLEMEGITIKNNRVNMENIAY
jgi:methylated-DNA-[protein]-cysteine S-methyltransferase